MMELFNNHTEDNEVTESVFDGRILVVSNEAMSYSSSNGRSMLMLLEDIPPSNVAQFSIHGNREDGVCKTSFQISDKDALRAFLHRKPKEEKDSSNDKNDGRVYNKTIVRNCRNLVLRNMVWNSFAWWKKDFDAFLEDVSPDIVLLQAGDMPVMYKIARKIAKRFGCPLAMYNTENYVLKDVMYSSASKRSIWHFILHRSLKKEYRAFMKCASYCIYNTEFLEKAYQEKYPHHGKSTAVYMSSKIQPMEFVKTHSEFSLLYCGNLGVGRSEVLAETAEILYRVDSTAVMDIYGKFPDEESETTVCMHPNVRFHGVVSYDEVLEQMKHASMLLHCENPNRVKNLQTAFSTKIADNIASGRPFLVYASDEYPFVQYLHKNQCAHIAGSAQELEKILKNCIDDADYCNQYHKNEIRTAFQSHNPQNSAKKVRRILSSLLVPKETR